MYPLITARLFIVTELARWSIALIVLAMLAGCDLIEPSTTPSAPAKPAATTAEAPPSPPPPPAAPATWWDRLTQTGGTAEYSRQYDGGGASSAREANASGPGLRMTADQVDVSKFHASAPAANAGDQPSAQGGGVDAAFRGLTDSGKTAVRIVLVLLGAVGIGYGIWLLKTKAALKDAAIAGAVGAGFIAAAIEPAIVFYAVGAAVVLLLLRFGPLALQARAYEPARAVIDGIGTVEKRAKEMRDDGKEITFKSTREFLLEALKIMKAEIASQQTGDDRDITRAMKSPDLP